MLDTFPPDLRGKWAAARVWAAHQAPYLAHALLALHPVAVDRDGLSRFPADTRWHVHVSPHELDRQSVREVGFWLVHQLTHLLREHARRCPATHWNDDRRRWNLAADAEINDDLAFGALPPQAATPKRLGLPDGGTAEQYWAALPNLDHTELLDGDCGSACDGLPRVWDHAGPGLSRTGARLTALDTARRIREHHRLRDDLPAGWLRWADHVLEPTVNWRRRLSASIRRGVADVAGRVDFTYRRPSRRSAALPHLVLPSLRRPLPSVALLIDTSGSVSDAMLAQAVAETAGVLRAVGVGRGLVKVISCDARAYRAQSLARISDLRLGGGGGTDLRTGFAAALALRPPPDLIIVLTDGLTPWPDRPPRTRVIIALLAAAQTPPWADTVLIGAAS
ncbi:VWA-like domain-containing protein [Nonomuraea purpurea]|uniref:VWA-like domain-containing protein n=1 Tax=Nonomuraea purpurea TaxID=1849276 RepID=A0ABV8G6D1_9ACTN